MILCEIYSFNFLKLLIHFESLLTTKMARTHMGGSDWVLVIVNYECLFGNISKYLHIKLKFFLLFIPACRVSLREQYQDEVINWQGRCNLETGWLSEEILIFDICQVSINKYSYNGQFQTLDGLVINLWSLRLFNNHFTWAYGILLLFTNESVTVCEWERRYTLTAWPKS